MNSEKPLVIQVFLVGVNLALLLLYIISAIYLAIGHSASTSPLDSADILIILMFVVITIPHACIGIAAFMKKGRDIKLFKLSGAIGLFLISLGFVVGDASRKAMTQETKEAGDIILGQLSAFILSNGYCPKTLLELAETGVTIPETSINKSTFELYAHEKTCTLSFQVDSWVVCSKTIPNQEYWYCAD